MKKNIEDEVDDLHVCKTKILEILQEYNCSIETDDYHWAWIRDNDTNKTVGIGRG